MSGGGILASVRPNCLASEVQKTPVDEETWVSNRDDRNLTIIPRKLSMVGISGDRFRQGVGTSQNNQYSTSFLI